MRENRKSGSEGGAGLIPRPDPYPPQKFTIHYFKFHHSPKADCGSVEPFHLVKASL